MWRGGLPTAPLRAALNENDDDDRAPEDGAQRYADQDSPRWSESIVHDRATFSTRPDRRPQTRPALANRNVTLSALRMLTRRWTGNFAVRGSDRRDCASRQSASAQSRSERDRGTNRAIPPGWAEGAGARTVMIRDGGAL